MTVGDLFRSVGLSPSGGICWGAVCSERRAGVYVVSINGSIVYVGRTKRSLSRRLREFFRHKYGDKRPHRGGQEVLRMAGSKVVHWCATDDPRDAEMKMLRAFEGHCGQLPSGNRRRGDRESLMRTEERRKKAKT